MISLCLLADAMDYDRVLASHDLAAGNSVGGGWTQVGGPVGAALCCTWLPCLVGCCMFCPGSAPNPWLERRIVRRRIR